MFFLSPQKLFSQLRDGSNCGKAVKVPLPAEVCNRRDYQIKEREMWFEFQGSGTEVSLKLSPGAQNPVNELTVAILLKERGGCPDLEEIKREPIGRLEHEKHINLSRLEHGVNYKLKLEREVRIPENFEMCLMRGMPPCHGGLYLKNDQTGLALTRVNNNCYKLVPGNCVDYDCTIAESCAGVTLQFSLEPNNLIGSYQDPDYTVDWIFTYLGGGVDEFQKTRFFEYQYTFLSSGTYEVEAQIYKARNDPAEDPPLSRDIVKSTGKLIVQVNEGLQFEVMADPEYLCNPGTVTLSTSSASTNYNYKWFTTQNNNIWEGDQITTTINTTSTYTVVATDENQSACTASKEITIPVYENPEISIEADKSEICKGEEITLTAAGAQSYLWNTGSASSSITVSPLITTLYTVTGYIGSCSAQYEFNINVYEVPEITITPQNPEICKGESVTLSATAGGSTFAWSPSAGLYTTSSGTVTATPTGTTTYTVTATNATGCTSTKSVTVTIINVPSQITITSTKNTICKGETIYLIASSGFSAYSWWSNPPGFSATSSVIPIVSPEVNTNYYVTGTVAGATKNCTKTTNKIIYVTSAPPAPVITGPTNTCNAGNVYTATYLPSGAILQWEIIDGTQTTFKTGNPITYTWINSEGGTVKAETFYPQCPALRTESNIITVTACPCDIGVSYCQVPGVTLGGNLNISSYKYWLGNMNNPFQKFLCINYYHQHANPGSSQYYHKYYFKGTITVNSGAQLYIKDIAIYFSPESGVIVKKGNTYGGRLKMDNATLSATGTTCMWKGVEVEGKIKSYYKDDNKSGLVSIKNKSLIEHAHIAVLSGSSTDVNNVGGIVSANEESVFRNNDKGIVFQSDYSHVFDQTSLIKNCRFICNVALRDVKIYGSNASSSFFIYLSYVSGSHSYNQATAIISNNYFESMHVFDENDKPIANKTTAIFSTNAEFGAVGNTFNNLKIGIYSTWTYQNLNVYIQIENNNFQEIWKTGIRVINLNGDIKSNKFELNFFSQPKRKAAIVAENCADLAIANNQIQSFTQGIVSLANNWAYIKISKNDIFNATTAIGLGGKNNYTNVYCNNLNNYGAGIRIYDYMGSGNAEVKEQGHCEGSYQKDFPAGNHFFPLVFSNPDIVNSSTGTFEFKYIYDQASVDNGDLSVIPNVVRGNVTVTSCNTDGMVTIDGFCNQFGPVIEPVQRTKPSSAYITDFQDSSALPFMLHELLQGTHGGNNEDLLITFLKEINTLEAKKLLIPILINKKRIVEARTELNSIPLDNTENIHCVNFYMLYCLLWEQGKTWYDMDSAQIQFIRDMAESNTSYNANAKAVLSLVFGEQFPLTCEMLGNCENNARWSKNNETKEMNLSKNAEQFEIIPNPSKDEAFIILRSGENIYKGELMLYDISGFLLQSIPFISNSNETRIKTQGLSEGIYLCVIQIPDREKIYRKLVIVK